MLPGIYQRFMAVAPFLFPSFYFNSLWASYVCSMWCMPKYDRRPQWVHICTCFLFSLVSFDFRPYPFKYISISNPFPSFNLSPLFRWFFLSPIHSPEPVATWAPIDLEAIMISLMLSWSSVGPQGNTFRMGKPPKFGSQTCHDFPIPFPITCCLGSATPPDYMYSY